MNDKFWINQANFEIGTPSPAIALGSIEGPTDDGILHTIEKLRRNICHCRQFFQKIWRYIQNKITHW